MSRELTSTLLGEVARRTLEEAAFLFSDEPSPDLALEAPVVEASLPFEGPTRGSLTLRMSETLAVEAAANLLGVDGADPEAKENAAAAVGELLNMLSGTLLTAWHGAQARCSLGTPSVSIHDEWAGPATPPSVAAAFLAGESALVQVEARLEGALEGRR